VMRAVESSDLHNATHVWVIEEQVARLETSAPFLYRYKSRLIELFACALIINLFALTLPLFSSFVYDKILGNGITDTLWALVIGLMIVVGIELCVRILRIAVAERFAVGSEVDIDHSTFRNLLDAEANKMPGIGAMLEKYKQVLSFRDFLSSSYLLALADLPFLVLFLLVIAVVAGPLVFVPLLCGIAMLIANLVLALPAQDYDRKAKQAGERRFGLMTDVLTARDAILGSALRNELSRRWGQASVTAISAGSQARYWRGFSMTIANSLSYISFIAILVGGVYMVEAHTLTSGGLLAASMLTSRAMSGFASIITLVTRAREFRLALHELNQIIPATARNTHKARGRLQGGIRVDKVTCRLREGDTPVLRDIAFTIAPGEIVGIAGAPGAGKTTLLRLIAGVLQPDEGRVLIDNIPLQHLGLDDVSENIGYKPQDFGLLDGTIEENVRAGRVPLSAEARQDVLNRSGLARAFQENGLNWATEVGARGSNISGGQRQLVALARALLYTPTLLILDEPSNGLDAPLEAHLAQQLAQLRGKHTVIVSTHSRNLLAICDRIIVIGQSKILADGPRDKVLA
nr:ATP-binding cassette domain-containing protein [Alphaproteobacteria bacterium]